jgi:parallel beta-helix repeat protein
MSIKSLLIVSVILLFLSACSTTNGVANLWVRSDGNLVGIIFKNGVECLGEDAQPLPDRFIYVSPEGDDSNPGTETAPLGTLAFALCNLEPGQTLNVMTGTYKESIIMGAFGNSTLPIVIRAHPNGDSLPVLDGESSRTMGIALVESTNITIQGLEFKNYTDEGLLILEGSDFTIRNNLFRANGRASIDPDHDDEGFGVNVLGARNVLIEGNESVNNGPNQERWENFALGTGINTYENRDVIIRDNFIHGTIGGGILVEDSFHVLVENNLIQNNQLDANADYWDGGIWVDGGQDITLRNNQIYDHNGPGIVLSDEDVQYPQASFGFVVENNLISGNLVGMFIWNWGQCPVEESIIRLSENQLESNHDGEYWCVEWECGEGQPCE